VTASSGNPSVIDILRQRAAARTVPPHGDGHSVALCVEGGAMRGVVSAGMVTGLEQLGMTTAFDAVYGSSAGAFNSAYFLAGQAALGTRIYSEDINGHAFIDMKRAFGPRPIVDLDFLVDEVMTRRKPLDVARVIASPTAFTVLVTDADSTEPVALRQFTSRDEIFAAMRASSTMPVMAGGPSAFRGRTYVDASLTEPVPVPTAEADGHTHILVLLSRPGGHRRSLSALIERIYVTHTLRKQSPALAKKFAERGRPYAALIEAMATGRGPCGRAAVQVLRPASSSVGKLECRRDVLERAGREGVDMVREAFRP
jgi:predicted patatin/cPLA2 family phospholipase